MAGYRYEWELRTVVAIRDAFPVTEGHYLVIPRRHAIDFFGMTSAERRDSDELLAAIADSLRHLDASIVGFNIGMNCGQAAGQTVPHAHTHLIPRRVGDTPVPRGGVRGVIPEKMNY
jgi:diadenosine tetraphosphate (Ap4A) HIT family hydrolase